MSIFWHSLIAFDIHYTVRDGHSYPKIHIFVYLYLSMVKNENIMKASPIQSHEIKTTDDTVSLFDVT